MKTRLLLFLTILTLRLLNALTLRTFFQPDEFFQSLEPAWNLAFGPQSGAWLTWEWHHQLRSSLHPLLFAGWYKLAFLLSQSFSEKVREEILVMAPRLLQAGIAAMGDWYTFKFAARVYGGQSLGAYTTLALQIASPWQWYVSTRTFSNSLETTLTIMALASYPWELLHPSSSSPTKENPNGKPQKIISINRLRDALCLAALAIILRPTNIFIWAPIALVTLSHCTKPNLLIFLREGITCGASVLSMSALADKWYFGFWVFPPWKWLNFNVSKSLAVFYGRNPWHYYLLQGLPLLCTTSLIFVLQALHKPLPPNKDKHLALQTLKGAVFTTITTLSLISHKEVRFIYPLLPILNVLAAPYAASFFTTTTNPLLKKQPTPNLRNKAFLFTALTINTLLAGYLSYFHQSAPLTIMSFLRTEFTRTHHNQVANPNELFALFLTPCHSTPWRSHLVHPDLNAYALSCEPPLHTLPNTPERENYRDEADRFYDDPIRFLSSELWAEGSDVEVPRYIVGFEGIEGWLNEIKDSDEGKEVGLREVKKVWETNNGLFNEDWRRSGKMVVWDTGRYEA